MVKDRDVLVLRKKKLTIVKGLFEARIDLIDSDKSSF